MIDLTVSEAPDGIKKCKGCQAEKPLSEFFKCSNRKDGKNSKCKVCVGKVTRKYYDENREKTLRTCKAWALKKRYGISMEDYNRMVEEQDGVCAVCSKPSVHAYLTVDHDHSTGKTRGLLCTLCNTGIGALGDDVEGLERALKYLKKAL